MEPVKFPESNVTWAEDQPDYLPLPAYTDHQQTVTCWSVTWRERLYLLWTGRLWLSQLNFGQPLQPQLLTTGSPFVKADGCPTVALEV